MIKAYRVALINVGERLPVCVDAILLSKKLNSIQSAFSFEVVLPIPAEVLEGPDVRGQWYYFDRIFEIIRRHQEFSRYDYVVGITHVRLIKDENSGDDGNRDCFSWSDLSKTSLITLNHNVTTYNSKTKDIYQFIGFNVLGELLCNLTRTYLYHDKVNHCLFDECVDRGNVEPAINRSFICSGCNNILKQKGISNLLLCEIQKILDWCGRNIGEKSPLYLAISHPITYLVIGADMGWGISVFFKSNQYIYVLIVSAAVPATLFFNYFFKSRKELKIT